MKPDWSKAPEWAQWWAMNRSGASYWYEFQPVLETTHRRWESDDDYDGRFEGANTDMGWESSLEERPRVEALSPTRPPEDGPTIDRVKDADVIAALDRMDNLLDPACGFLTVTDDSVTVKASRADLALIRRRLAEDAAPASQPKAEVTDSSVAPGTVKESLTVEGPDVQAEDVVF